MLKPLKGKDRIMNRRLNIVWLNDAAYFRKRSNWDKGGIMGQWYWRDMCRRAVANAKLTRNIQTKRLP